MKKTLKCEYNGVHYAIPALYYEQNGGEFKLFTRENDELYACGRYVQSAVSHLCSLEYFPEDIAIADFAMPCIALRAYELEHATKFMLDAFCNEFAARTVSNLTALGKRGKLLRSLMYDTFIESKELCKAVGSTDAVTVGYMRISEGITPIVYFESRQRAYFYDNGAVCMFITGVRECNAYKRVETLLALNLLNKGAYVLFENSEPEFYHPDGTKFTIEYAEGIKELSLFDKRQYFDKLKEHLNVAEDDWKVVGVLRKNIHVYPLVTKRDCGNDNNVYCYIARNDKCYKVTGVSLNTVECDLFGTYVYMHAYELPFMLKTDRGDYKGIDELYNLTMNEQSCGRAVLKAVTFEDSKGTIHEVQE